MSIRKFLLSAILSYFLTGSVHAQVVVSDHAAGRDIFSVVSSSKALVCYDRSDDEAVKRAVGLFLEDVRIVTGKAITSRDGLPSKMEQIIIVGTVGKSKLIGQLAQKNKLDVRGIEGGWEQYRMELVANPFPGIRKALVIAGSDRRGTAYGLLSVSEAIGVSPWYWWADVPVKKRPALHLKVNPYTSKKTIRQIPRNLYQ